MCGTHYGAECLLRYSGSVHSSNIVDKHKINKPTSNSASDLKIAEKKIIYITFVHVPHITYRLPTKIKKCLFLFALFVACLHFALWTSIKSDIKLASSHIIAPCAVTHTKRVQPMRMAKFVYLHWHCLSPHVSESWIRYASVHPSGALAFSTHTHSHINVTSLVLYTKLNPKQLNGSTSTSIQFCVMLYHLLPLYSQRQMRERLFEAFHNQLAILLVRCDGCSIIYKPVCHQCAIRTNKKTWKSMLSIEHIKNIALFFSFVFTASFLTFQT